MNQSVVLITGATSGIGEICAKHLHGLGYRVYGAGRRFQDKKSTGFEAVRMDVAEDDSVTEGVRRIIEKEGRIDVVLNCAGYGLAGSIEDTSIEEVRALFETNFFGVIRVCKAALPAMRQQQSGLIINVSSIGGLISLPFQAFYSASKFALEGMTEALRLEVQHFGIRVVLIEPGDFKTQFTGNRQQAIESRRRTVYQDRFRRALSINERDESKGHDPIIIAYLVERIIKSTSPKLRYSIGPVFERMSPKLKMILPDQLTEWLTLKYFGLL